MRIDTQLLEATVLANNFDISNLWSLREDVIAIQTSLQVDYDKAMFRSSKVNFRRIGVQLKMVQNNLKAVEEVLAQKIKGISFKAVGYTTIMN